jgi:predicted flap endonuclease-1-like 5' DNA nuclease
MSLLFNLLLRGKATNTHHKVALHALSQLKRHDADEWQNVFLAEIDAYLRGAKAPDEEFRDFRNHVLHVRENGWGGAAEAADQWYQKTVQALSKRQWPEAVYNAGVLSHYLTDPMHPFHTAQSEREMIVHRAVEHSIAQSYEELHALIGKEQGGYPDVKLASDNRWLASLIRQGAEQAHAQYDFLIDHYHFEMGVRNPTAGLDREAKAAVAKLIAFATAALARVLDKAIAEAGVLVPHVVVSFQAIYESMSAPVRALAKRKLAAREQALLEAMYREFQQTGKVIEQLAEGDKIVRRLHAEEVLKISLAELDKQPAGRTGTKYTGPLPAAPAPVAGAGAKPAIETSVAKPVAKRDDLNAPKLAPTAPNTSDARTNAAAAAPSTTTTGGDKATSLPFPAKGAAGQLTANSPLVDAPSIGPKTAERFVPLGIHTIAQFLAASAETMAKSLKVGHITPQVLVQWQHQARLVLELPRLRGHDAQLLVAVGMHSCEELARANARDLFELLKEFAGTPEGKRMLRDAQPPDLVEVSQWVVAAKKTRRAQAA